MLLAKKVKLFNIISDFVKSCDILFERWHLLLWQIFGDMSYYVIEKDLFSAWEYYLVIKEYFEFSSIFMRSRWNFDLKRRSFHYMNCQPLSHPSLRSAWSVFDYKMLCHSLFFAEKVNQINLFISEIKKHSKYSRNFVNFLF